MFVHFMTQMSANINKVSKSSRKGDLTRLLSNKHVRTPPTTRENRPDHLAKLHPVFEKIVCGDLSMAAETFRHLKTLPLTSENAP